MFAWLLMVGDASPCYLYISLWCKSKLDLDLGSWHAVELLYYMICTFDGEERM
jgi:hypothetical protein